MRKRITITLDEAMYEDLQRRVGKRRMRGFIEELVKLHVPDSALDDGYRAMADDGEREAEALEWRHALARGMADRAR